MAFVAHDRKLIMVLSNVPELATNLANVFDIALAEQCLQYGECDKYQPFISRGKPVLAAEYSPKTANLCSQAASFSLSLSFFNRQLDGSRYETCP